MSAGPIFRRRTKPGFALAIGAIDRKISQQERGYGMKNAIWALAMLASLAMPVSANAADHFHTAYVAGINALTNGGYILTLTADSSNCPSTSTPKQYFAMPGQNAMTVEGAAVNYANTILAMQTGRQITIFFTDTSALCYIGNTKISN